jgi:hypothetical protein
MYGEDLKLGRKRGWLFSCAMIGAGIAFLALLAAVVICSNQFAAVSTLTLQAAPGETVANGIPYLYFNPIAYAAAIDGQGTPIERVGLYPEHQQSLEFICRDGALITQNLDDPSEDTTYLVDFRLINDCDRPVTVQVCWWNAHSLLGPFFLPSCAI